MTARSIETLLDPLADMTEGGKLRWERKNHNTFFVQLSRYQLTLWNWTSEASDTEGVTARILDEQGNVIDETSADEFSLRYTKLKGLFDNARRSANDVEAVVSDIERELRFVSAP